MRTYVDLAAKPHWLLEVNPPRGTVPAMKDVESGKWIVDSDVIVDYLEDRFPEPALGTAADSPQVGNAIFSAWIGYSKASDEEEADKAAALKAAVQELEGEMSGWVVTPALRTRSHITPPSLIQPLTIALLCVMQTICSSRGGPTLEGRLPAPRTFPSCPSCITSPPPWSTSG